MRIGRGIGLVLVGFGLLVLTGFGPVVPEDASGEQQRFERNQAERSTTAQASGQVIVLPATALVYYQSLRLCLGTDDVVIELGIGAPGVVPARETAGTIGGALHMGPDARQHFIYDGGAVNPPLPPETAHLYRHAKLVRGGVTITPDGPIETRAGSTMRPVVLRFTDLVFDDGTVIRIAGPVRATWGCPPPP